MKEVEGSLLALIHQHLLQAGYSKAARELQMQSGKKFSTPEVSLQDIYKDWIKHPEKDKTKKTVQVNNQGVKVRVPDPESSTESSEDELVFYSPAGSRTLSNATPQVQQTKEKNNKKKPTAKEKAATTISKMSSGVNATSGQNKKAVSAIPQAPKVVMESSSSSDSEEDQAPQKAAPVKISTKPVAESTESSSGSESDMETTGQNVVGKKLTANNLPATPGSVKKPLPNAAPNGKVASQAKAIVKPDLKNISESSDSSDSEEENESQTHTVLAHVHAPPRTPLLSPSKTARAAVPAKAAVVTKPVDIDESESSDSSDSEIIVTQASQKKPSDPTAAKPLVTKTPNLAQPGKVATPTKTPVSAKPLTAQSSESSDSSDSEEELNAKNTAAPLQASQKKTIVPPTSTRPPGTKTPLLAKPGTLTTPAKASVVAQSSESSDSSDSELEPDAKKTAAPLQGSQKNIPATPSTATRPPGTKTPLLAKPGKLATPTKASVVAKPLAAQSSESSDSSDSEEEPDTKKTAVPLQGSQKKTPVTPSTAARPPGTKTPLLAKPGTLATPAKASVVPQSSESSDSSDSELEPDAKKTAAPLQGSQKNIPATPSTATRPPGTKTPLLAKPGKLATPTKASVVAQPLAAQSSESSDSSDSEEEPDTKKTAVPLQGSQKKTPVTPSTAARPPGTKTPLLAKPGTLATPAKASVVAQSSESSDSSDSELEPDAKKTAAPLQGSQKKTPATAARPPETKAPLLAKPGKLATPTKASVVAQPLAAQSSESSDSSDSEEEPDAKKTAAPLQGSQKKTPATPSTATRPPGTKTPLLTKPGKLATPTKTPVISLPLAESSDSSESEDEPAVKNAQLSVVASKNNSKTTLLAKTGKLAAPAKTPAVTQPPVAESSESSNSSDSEEELNNKQKTAAPPQASQKKGKSPLLASTGNAATPAKTPVVAQPLTAQSSESSNSSDSEEEPDAKKINASLNPTTSASQAFATMKPTAKQDCDSSDTSEEAEGKSRSLVGQPSVTIISETSDTTDIDEVVSPTPAPIKATKGKAVPILAKTVTPSSLKATKSKASSAAKTAKAVQQIAVANSDSSDSLDSDEDPGVKQTPSVPLKKVKSGKGAKLTAVCVSGGNQKLPSSLPVPSLQKPSVSDVSEPSDSSDSDIDTGAQSLVAPVHAVPTPQKRKRNPKVKAQVTQPPAASVKHKKKSKAEQLAASAQPAPEPVIDSEEETIMALLSGQSPKKGKQKLSKLGLKAAPSATPLPVQKNGSVSDSSDDSDIGTATLNIVTPPALELRPPTADKEKKSAKKRKSSSEDGPKKKAKKAKKEGKKEKKKSKAEGGEAGASTPKAKSSKKDKKKLEKSEKKKSSKKKKEKKKKDGEKKEAKKTKKGSATGVSPKPKKKKKSKADKVD
ncbi:treacle protein isoform X6 [Xenopus tropicalis]|uniref:Treacle protein isoform X6 n=1 Tax=Xenopus tropicalis TaxID=8364 RepID=A0A8J1JC48_XENTR|nr:treacle protein isoform X6 [Xenopus tropicalis]